jgi:hypothetical protein
VIVLRKIVYISKRTGSPRYRLRRPGTANQSRSVLVTIIAVISITPSRLQLKARGLLLLAGRGSHFAGWFISLPPGIFASMFGARRLDASERRGGTSRRVRVGDQACRLPRRRDLRHLRAVQRFRRHLRQDTAGALCFAYEDRHGFQRQLPGVDFAHIPLHDGHHVPAPPVPRGCGRKLFGRSHQKGHVAVPALSVPDQHLRPPSSPGFALNDIQSAADYFVLQYRYYGHPATRS